MKSCLILLVVLLSVLESQAAEFKLTRRHGEPIADRKEAWNRHIESASWVDEDKVVFHSRPRTIACLSVETSKIVWSIEAPEEIIDWSVSRGTKRLAYLHADGAFADRQITILDCVDGKKIQGLDGTKLAQFLGLDDVIPTRLAFFPSDGRLLVYDSEFAFGRNGHILDATYTRVDSSFEIDAWPREISLSPDGKRVAVIADDSVFCIRDLKEDRDVFFRGTRVLKEPLIHTLTIDAPFFSHLRHDGRDRVIYTEDDSWGTGQVFVSDLDGKNLKSFDARNGHIEIDVAFDKKRMALTGTSADLTLMDLDGNVLAHKENVTMQRNVSVEFCPTGKRVLVGSWDSTVSIFAIVEDEAK